MTWITAKPWLTPAANAIPEKPVIKAPDLTSFEVVFVNYAPFGRASGIHIFHLANELEKLGVRSAVYVPSDVDSTRTFGEPRFLTRTFRSATIRAYFSGKTRKTIIHAWTPRERVRRLTESLHPRIGSRYIVHLEDNEEAIHEAMMNSAGSTCHGAGGGSFPEHLSDPNLSRSFLERASGITCIAEQLEDFVPADVPRHVIRPACEPHIFFLPEQPNERIRAHCGFGRDDFVLVYPGNVHAANAEDVDALYGAIARLNSSGHRVRLLRIGEDHVRSDTAAAARQAVWLTHISVPDHAIPDYLEGADALVQPGRPNAFNQYRFPSKIPMFLASGRPVILFNPDRDLPFKDGENCFLLEEGSADEIAVKLEKLINNVPLRAKLGRSGRNLAREIFSWERSAERLLGFYRTILDDEYRSHPA